MIPINERPERSAIFAEAEIFGAQPVVQLGPDVTHCVTKNNGTEKTVVAQRMGIPVVWYGWYQRCVALWEKVDERDWLVNPPKSPEEASAKGTETRPPSGSSTPADTLGLEGIDGVEGIEKGGVGESSGKGWDEEYQKELEAMLQEGGSDDEDEDDEESEAGSTFSDMRSKGGRLVLVFPATTGLEIVC